ncbi:MAG: hypothetical protein AAGJ94_10300 [Pseudomonadota bacterium]
MTGRRFVIVDRAFTEFEGHHRSANELIAGAAAALGYVPVVLASKGARITHLDQGAPVEPLFEGSPYASAAEADAVRLGELNREAYTDFQRVPDAFLGEEAALYIHTTNENEVYGLSRWLAEASARRGCIGTVALMMPPGIHVDGDEVHVIDQPKASVYKRALDVLGSAQSNIVVQGISRSIAHEYSVLAGRDIHSTPALIRGVGRPLVDRSTHSRPRILLYIGDIKVDKGFHLIPQIALRLSQSSLAFDAFIQVSGSMVDRYQRFITALEQAVGGDDRFHLHHGRLSDDDYDRVWSTSDLAVLPYSPLKYRHQSSGMCWEAMNNCVPSIVAAGTWHEREMTSWGFAPVVVDTYWPQAFFEAIASALSDLGRLTQACVLQRDKFTEHNKPEDFVTDLLRLHNDRARSSNDARFNGQLDQNISGALSF